MITSKWIFKKMAKKALRRGETISPVDPKRKQELQRRKRDPENKKRVIPQAHRDAISKKLTGSKRTPEQRARMSKGQLRRWSK